MATTVKAAVAFQNGLESGVPHKPITIRSSAVDAVPIAAGRNHGPGPDRGIAVAPTRVRKNPATNRVVNSSLPRVLVYSKRADGKRHDGNGRQD